MKKIKVAQIGTSENSHGSAIWKSLLKLSDDFEVIGYAFPEREREKFPKQMKYFDGYREMTVKEILDDPEIEAVVVETEEIYLTKYALMVASSGKHLHMEKPGGTSLEDFRALVHSLKSQSLTFSLGYMYRFNPTIREVLERVKKGELGEIYAVEAHMDCKHPKEVREWLGAFPGGMMFFLGCHLIDLIYQIQGEPQRILPLNGTTGFDGVASEDYGMVVLQYPKGISFAKTCAAEYGGFLRRQLVICGEKGTIEIKPLELYREGAMYTVVSENRQEGWHEPWSTRQSEPYTRYDDMMKNFAEMIRGKENPYSYEYELGLYELILKCCKKES